VKPNTQVNLHFADRRNTALFNVRSYQDTTESSLISTSLLPI